MVKCLGLHQANKTLVDLLIMAGAVYNKKISTLLHHNIEEIIHKLNDTTATSPTHSDKSVGEILIETEEKDPDCKEFNIQFFKTMRAFVFNSPPILTMKLKLGRLKLKNAV